MRKLMLKLSVALSVAGALPAAPAMAWGEIAHKVVDRAAIAALPADGPIFLKKYADYVGKTASMPDTWRSATEPFAKIQEDPNHGWFREQFAFMKNPPRSRYEFVLALYDAHREQMKTDPEVAARTNVRWTGTLPYAAMESYGRLVANMRSLRRAMAQGEDVTVWEQNCAYEVAVLGHYIGDGSQPLHVSENSDGWRGNNPKGYTTDRTIHGRFEGQYVEKINLTEADVAGRIPEVSRQSGDLFDHMLAFLDDSYSHMEGIYRLEQQGALADPNHKGAREMVYARVSAGAAMLRDLLTRAWAESANLSPKAAHNPFDFNSPAFNPATGSAPAARP